MTTFYLVRHGESQGNANRAIALKHEYTQLGTDLTDQGITQAKELAIQVKSVEFDLALSSTLLRGKKTAEFLVSERQLDLKTTDTLRERYRGQIVGELEEQLAGEHKNIFDAMEVMTKEMQNTL